MKILFFFASLFLAINLFAIDIDLEIDNAYKLTLKDNSIISGYFIHKTTKSIKLSNIDSTFTIIIDDVKEIKIIEDEYVLVAIYPYVVNKYYWFKYKNGKKRRGKFIKIQEPYLFLKSGQLDFKVNINDIEYLNEKKAILKKTSEQVVNYYLMRSTAFPVKKNALTISTIYTYGNFKYGLNDNFSIGGGVEAASLSVFFPIFTLNTDIYLPIAKNQSLSFGLNYTNFLLFGFFTSRNEDSLIIPSLTNFSVKYSFGNNMRNFTLGLDLMKYTDEDYNPVINFSGIFDFSDNFYLSSENNIITGNDNLILYSINGFKIKFNDYFIYLGVQTFLSENDKNLNEIYEFINSRVIPLIGVQTIFSFRN